MYASTRRKKERQRRTAAVWSIVVALSVAFSPQIASGASGAKERFVTADANGDTAQAIASRIGRRIADEMNQGAALPSTLVPAPNGTGTCGVRSLPSSEPLPDVEFSCFADISYGIRDETQQTKRSYFVVVKRRGQTFVWDSAQVLGTSA